MLNQHQVSASITAANGRIRCAIYARYSSDNQDESSTQDQIRNCRAAAARNGWEIVEECIFFDEEKTGTTLFNRPGFDQLMTFAKSKPKRFEYVLFDDASRMSRNTADALKTVDILKHHRVSVYFVNDGLDSSNPWFEDAFLGVAQRSAQFSKLLSYKVSSGRLGRFDNGYNPGGGCYGYKNVRVEDLSRKGLHGHPAVIGMRQEIVPEEAAIVIRIFKAYASGKSLLQIATMLNEEGVPTSQGPRSRRKACWHKTAIKEILRNERYCGRTYWGRTKEELDPETGKRVRSNVPEEQWKRKDIPALRIVTDELWDQVQAQFRMATRGLGVKRLGGMTRTEASRKYLFSGLLKCGVCGGNMKITRSQPTGYGCVNHRDSNSCANRTTILLKSLEEAFMDALSENLKPGLLQEELVQALLRHLKTVERQSKKDRAGSEAQRDQMEATRGTLHQQMENLVAAIRDSGNSRFLIDELKNVEAKIGRIDEALENIALPAMPEITDQEVRSFVSESASSLSELLAGSPETVRHELQKRIHSITLTPTVDERGSTYRVTGDVGLFSRQKGVLQNNQVHLIALDYTLPISFDVMSKSRSQKRVLEGASNDSERPMTGSAEGNGGPDELLGNSCFDAGHDAHTAEPGRTIHQNELAA